MCPHWLITRGRRPEIWSVVLDAQDETGLLSIERKLRAAGIDHVAIREPDLGNALTAIGIGPGVPRNQTRKVVSCLPLLKTSTGSSKHPLGGPVERSVSNGEVAAFESRPVQQPTAALPNEALKRGDGPVGKSPAGAPGGGVGQDHPVGSSTSSSAVEHRP